MSYFDHPMREKKRTSSFAGIGSACLAVQSIVNVTQEDVVNAGFRHPLPLTWNQVADTWVLVV
jgi:hypothetical protein